MTGEAIRALEGAEAVIGYRGYLEFLTDLLPEKKIYSFEIGEEIARAERAVTLAREGHPVAIVSSGDAGIFGMASLVLEAVCRQDDLIEVVVLPGITAIVAAASLLGAPLSQDFSVISLSDLITPWERIERRLIAAASADFVVVLMNPKSQKRTMPFQQAHEILLRFKNEKTPVGVVQNAYRSNQKVTITTLKEMDRVEIDMFTTVIIGNNDTTQIKSWLITPRGSVRAWSTTNRHGS